MLLTLENYRKKKHKKIFTVFSLLHYSSKDLDNSSVKKMLQCCLLIILNALEIDITDENMNISCLFFLQAAALPKGAKVEIEAIAMVGEIIDENLQNSAIVKYNNNICTPILKSKEIQRHQVYTVLTKKIALLTKEYFIQGRRNDTPQFSKP